MKNTALRILLVEDNILDAKAARRALEKSDLTCEITHAKSSGEAKRILAESTFDLAILDFRLGAETGLDVLEVLGDLPAIIATGSGNEDVAVQAMRKGAYDYVVKDGRGNYLALLPRVVDNVVKRRQAEIQQIELIEQLQAAAEQINTLEKFIPICCNCRKLRSKEGYWQRLEAYLEEHTTAKLTHGYCKSCADEAMRELDDASAAPNEVNANPADKTFTIG